MQQRPWAHRAILVASLGGFALPAYAWDLPPPPPTPPSRCVANCGGGYVPRGPAGPTPEEKRRMWEEKDSRDAADDAEDRGVDAYQSGDYDKAVRLFREALEYEPDDPDIQENLRKAQQRADAAREARERRARESEAVRQLTGAAQHSAAAAATADKREAGQVFDTYGGRGRALPGGAVYAGSGGAARDPVVPASKRTPKITAMERQRKETRARIKALDEKLKKLNPATDAVEIVKIRQEKSTARSKVQYLNFSISEALDKPVKGTAGGAAK